MPCGGFPSSHQLSASQEQTRRVNIPLHLPSSAATRVLGNSNSARPVTTQNDFSGTDADFQRNIQMATAVSILDAAIEIANEDNESDPVENNANNTTSDDAPPAPAPSGQ